MAFRPVSGKLLLMAENKRQLRSFVIICTPESCGLWAWQSRAHVWALGGFDLRSAHPARLGRCDPSLRVAASGLHTRNEPERAPGTAESTNIDDGVDKYNRARNNGDELKRQRGCEHIPRFGTRDPQLCGISRELSTSAAALQFEIRKVNLSSSESKKIYFDTHAVVRLLEESGFTTKQSEIIVTALVKIMSTNMEAIYHDMVTKVQQEIMLQQVMSHIASVKKDMIILEKSEFSALRTENEKLHIELLQLKKLLTDEIMKVRSDSKLDTHLEKSRVKEMYTEHERKLLEIRTEIVELHAHQDRELTQTNRKIDTEVAGLKTMLESHKLDTIKYLAGSVFTCLTIALGFYRLWI